MHESALALAALPAATLIQRTPLLPYSLGHELFLIREGNAFLCGGTPTRKDLLQAVWICSNTWTENTASKDSWLDYFKAKLIARRFKKCDLAYCIQQFWDYLKSGSLHFPLSDIPRLDRPSAGRIPGAPFILQLHDFIMRRIGLTEALAWDYPVGLAKMRWAAHWEREGSLDIYGPQDEAFDKFSNDPKTKAMLEELRKKGSGRKAKCQV